MVWCQKRYIQTTRFAHHHKTATQRNLGAHMVWGKRGVSRRQDLRTALTQQVSDTSALIWFGVKTMSQDGKLYEPPENSKSAKPRRSYGLGLTRCLKTTSIAHHPKTANQRNLGAHMVWGQKCVSRRQGLRTALKQQISETSALIWFGAKKVSRDDKVCAPP